MLNRIFDFLANMGIWVRLNDPRHEPPSEEGREWGPAQDGFALSLKALGPDTLSVLLKNLDEVDKVVMMPGWLAYYQLSVSDPAGAPVPLKTYGRGVREDPANTQPVKRRIPAGKSLAAEIPLAVLYDLRPGVAYRVSASAPVPNRPAGPPLTSNDVVLPE